MSLPALETIRERFPESHITVLARPWVADLYQGATFCDQVLLYHPSPGFGDWGEKLRLAKVLRGIGFDLAILLPNSFDAALIAWLARIPERVGYARDGRSLLLTRAISVPKPGEIPAHERFYYLELLRRAGWISELPHDADARLRAPRRSWAELGLDEVVIGVSPGAAFGTAKRWLPERFAESAVRLSQQMGGASVAVFGSKEEWDVAEAVATAVANSGVPVRNLAGTTSLREFVERAASCSLFLTNDNGAMHIVSALGVPAVAIFGSTDPTTTGPAGVACRIVREPVECSPCLKRECPIDHRCMTRVTSDRVVEEALRILQ